MQPRVLAWRSSNLYMELVVDSLMYVRLKDCKYIDNHKFERRWA